MFFEDEKENINLNNPESIDDPNAGESITWDDLMDGKEDDLVSLPEDIELSDKQEDVVQEEVTVVLPEPTEAPTLVNIEEQLANDALESEMDLINDDGDESDVDDEELAKILNSPDSTMEEYIAQSYQDATKTPDDKEIDKQLEDVKLEEYEEDIPQIGIPEDKKQDKKLPPSILIPAIIVALLVVFCVHLIFKNKNKEDLDEVLSNNTQQEEVINEEGTTPEEVQDENIPVVNEEEVDTVKPDENLEKKEVVDVSAMGRNNPFLPMQKYKKVEVKQKQGFDYDSVDIPKPPERYGEMDNNTTNLMSIQVSGIMYDDKKPSAIISYKDNDYFVQKGDKLDSYTVIDIGKTYVKIASGKNTYRASIGENFKDDDFYGNNSFETKNGTRQYYSSESEYKNRDADLYKYTSDKDISVRAR